MVAAVVTNHGDASHSAEGCPDQVVPVLKVRDSSEALRVILVLLPSGISP